ncbi:MAG: 30S ribosome-binding factor RbfA [Gammaproteobacteria bacterium]
MPNEYSRADRLGGQLRRDLAELIRDDVRDPRVGMVSITEIRVSRDLAHARVFVTRIGDEKDREPAIEALNHAAGFLRRELGQRLRIRVIPQLRFQYDDVVEGGMHMEDLIAKAIKSDRGED